MFVVLLEAGAAAAGTGVAAGAVVVPAGASFFCSLEGAGESPVGGFSLSE